MIEKILSEGNKIEFTKVNSFKGYSVDEGRADKKVYVSQVFEIIDEYRLKIGVPIIGGKILLVPQNVKIDVCFYTSKGLYQGRAIVVDRFKEGNLYVMVIEMLTELQKYQRRQYFRLNCTMDIMFRKFTEEELAAYMHTGKVDTQVSENGLYNNAIALDISGGGIRFITSVELEREQMIFVNLQIAYEDEKKKYSLVGKVLESYPAKNKRDFYESRVEYCNMSGAVREQIIKYIFEQERKMRKNENSI